MPRRDRLASDLMSIGVLAPFVMGARMQLMAMEVMRPTAAGRREIRTMVSEKPFALVEATVAAQRSLFDASIRLWSGAAGSAALFFVAAPAAAFAASAAPFRRKVRANARRLRRS